MALLAKKKKFSYVNSGSDTEMEMESFFHGHPLILRDAKTSGAYRCSMCEVIFWDELIYCCSECKDQFAIHKHCAKFPHQIQHPSHPLHRLTFSGYDVFRCDCCLVIADWVGFRCKDCSFCLCTVCFTRMPTLKYEAHHHEHLLTFLDSFGGDPLCSSCKTSCKNGNLLRCAQCDFNLHQYCAELPKQIQHPFHPLHPLTLGNPPGDFNCHACNLQGLSCHYRCDTCAFDLDVECAKLYSSPTLHFEGHEHLLTLFEKVYEAPLCNSCDTPCDAFVLRCIDCNFYLHVHCHPSFPRSIEHECHVDSLAFTTCVVRADPFTLTTDSVPEEEEEEDDSSDEFYCDACEQKRNPKHPVYYCEDCSFVAHIGCVISAVLPLLMAEQESDAGVKKEETKPASLVEGLGATTEDYALARIDEKIEKLYMEAKEHTKNLQAAASKLEALEGERAQYIAQK